jgi:hypothetical protein
VYAEFFKDICLVVVYRFGTDKEPRRNFLAQQSLAAEGNNFAFALGKFGGDFSGLFFCQLDF